VLIQEALSQTRGNHWRACRLLGISYRALIYKIQAAGFRSKPAPPARGGASASVT